MKILFVGEIVGDMGRETVKKFLPQIIAEHKPDIVLANIENISHGRGATENHINEMLRLGINYFTGGDHIFWQRDSADVIYRMPIVVPANYPRLDAAKGYAIINTGSAGKLLLIQLMGRTSFNSIFSYLDDPFKKFDQIFEETAAENPDAILVDFHADSTSEKIAFGHYVDGRADAIIGTHTHVPTCDQFVLPKGTMFITDSGMTGSIDSVLGVKKDLIIEMFLTAKNQKFEWETTGRTAFRSVLLDTSEKLISRVDFQN